MEIVPTINSAQDFMELESRIKILDGLPRGLIRRVSIDVVDGKFASPASWPYTQDDDVDGAIKEFKDIKTDLSIELHMMVSYPEDFLDEWIDSPVDRIVIHAEALQDVENTLAVIDMSKTKSAVALKLDTDIDKIDEVVDRIDMIELMSIDKLGTNGAEFCPAVLKRIKEVKKRYPGKLIAVDGGINETNIKDIKKAGADFAQIGSAVWHGGKFEENILKLKKIIGD